MLTNEIVNTVIQLLNDWYLEFKHTKHNGFSKSPFLISKKAKQSIFVHTGFFAYFSPDHTKTVGDGTIERDLVLCMCEIIISTPIN